MSDSGREPRLGSRGEPDVRQLFSAVLAGDLDPADAQLARLCADDRALAQELEELLAARDRLDAFHREADQRVESEQQRSEQRFRQQAEAQLRERWAMDRPVDPAENRSDDDAGAGQPPSRSASIAAILALAAAAVFLAIWWPRAQAEPEGEETGPNLAEYTLGSEATGSSGTAQVILDESSGEEGLTGRRVRWPEVPGCLYRVQVVEVLGEAEEQRLLHEEELDAAEFFLPELPWPESPASVLLRIDRYVPGARRPAATHTLDLSAYL